MYAIYFTMWCPMVTCSQNNTLLKCHTYNVLHCSNNVRTSQVSLINLQWEQPHWGEGFLFPMDVFMIHFLSSWVVVALRFLRWERDVTSFPPRINTILGVTCFVMLDLTGPLRLCSHSGERKSNSAFNQTYEDLWSELTYFNIYKSEDCIVFPNLKHYSRSAFYQCVTKIQHNLASSYFHIHVLRHVTI